MHKGSEERRRKRWGNKHEESTVSGAKNCVPNYRIYFGIEVP